MAEVHIVPEDDHWKIEHDGDDLLVFDTREAAIHAGREVAAVTECELVVQPGPTGDRSGDRGRNEIEGGAGSSPGR